MGAVHPWTPWVCLTHRAPGRDQLKSAENIRSGNHLGSELPERLGGVGSDQWRATPLPRVESDRQGRARGKVLQIACRLQRAPHPKSSRPGIHGSDHRLRLAPFPSPETRVRYAAVANEICE